MDIASHLSVPLWYVEDYMTVQEVIKWRAFFTVCPPLHYRFDLMMGQLTAAVVNGYSKRSTDGMDFVPEWDKALKEVKKLTPEEEFNYIFSTIKSCVVKDKK